MDENRTLDRNGRSDVIIDVIDFFGTKTNIKPSVSGSQNNLHLNLGDKPLSKLGASSGETIRNTVGKVIEDGGEFIRIPFKWVKHMEQNWLIYLVCVTIICLFILYFYCIIRRYFACKKYSNTGVTSQLSDLAVILANNKHLHHRQNSNDLNLKKQVTDKMAWARNSVNTKMETMV